jgi:hypothetical protein
MSPVGTDTVCPKGNTRTVGVVATGKHKRTTIRAKRIATTHLTDTFLRRPKPPPPRVTG